MKIVLIGSGNTATVLGKKMYRCGHTVLQVFSRNLQHATALAEDLNASYTGSLNALSTDADLYVIAVSDTAVESVARQFTTGNKPVVHTAGSVSMEVLKPVSSNYGVLYPLQSLRKDMQRIPEIPFLVNGCTTEIQVLLCDFATSLSSEAKICTDVERLNMHLAAVISSNFTNHLYALTEQFCNHHQLSFDLLIPLIKEVAFRLNEGLAANLQTGPAIRGDEITIKKHMKLLEGDEQLQHVYSLLSQSIQKMYEKK